MDYMHIDRYNLYNRYFNLIKRSGLIMNEQEKIGKPIPGDDQT